MRGTSLVLAVAVAAVLVLQAGPAPAFVPMAQIQAALNGWDLIGRTPYAYQYTVSNAVRDYAAVNLDPALPWRGELAFRNFKFRGDDSGDNWTAVAAYDRPVNTWGWGVVVPEEYWSLDEIDDFLFEGVVPYVYYAATPQARVGVFGHVNKAFTDYDPGDEVSWGVGAFASYSYKATQALNVTPTVVYTHYSTGQDGWDDSDIFNLGVKLDYMVGAKGNLSAGFSYTTDTTNDLVDGTFWDVSVGGGYMVSDKVKLGAAFTTTQGFDDFDEAWTITGNIQMSF
jgi:hypothetical protein